MPDEETFRKGRRLLRLEEEARHLQLGSKIFRGRKATFAPDPTESEREVEELGVAPDDWKRYFSRGRAGYERQHSEGSIITGDEDAVTFDGNGYGEVAQVRRLGRSSWRGMVVRVADMLRCDE